MSDELIELEEEEHTSQLTGPVVKRILDLLRPHWKWVVGFITAILLTSILDAYFTYLNKQIVDVAIAQSDKSALMQIALVYGVLQIFQAGFVFTFIGIVLSVVQGVRQTPSTHGCPGWQSASELQNGCGRSSYAHRPSLQ